MMEYLECWSSGKRNSSTFQYSIHCAAVAGSKFGDYAYERV
jgi:hypothetical protein